MSKPAAPSDQVHKHPEQLLALVAKTCAVSGPSYAQTTAEWLKRHYPGSCAALLPKLREIYRQHKT